VTIDEAKQRQTAGKGTRQDKTTANRKEAQSTEYSKETKEKQKIRQKLRSHHT